MFVSSHALFREHDVNFDGRKRHHDQSRVESWCSIPLTSMQMSNPGDPTPPSGLQGHCTLVQIQTEAVTHKIKYLKHSFKRVLISRLPLWEAGLSLEEDKEAAGISRGPASL